MRMPIVALNRARAGIRAAVRAFRRWLEAEVRAAGGGGALAAKRINTACNAYAQLVRISKIIADSDTKEHPIGLVVYSEYDKPGCRIVQQRGLTHDQFLAYCDKQMKVDQTIDRAMVALGIEPQKKDPWTRMYEGNFVVNGSDDEEETTDANTVANGAAPDRGQADAAGGDGQDPTINDDVRKSNSGKTDIPGDETKTGDGP
jgi:hypothetical protein